MTEYSFTAMAVGGGAGFLFVLGVWALSERSARRHQARKLELLRRKLEQRRRSKETTPPDQDA
ncbi:MAG: hypothetical protein AAGL66_13850 [Pseudomonadota bacterium]